MGKKPYSAEPLDDVPVTAYGKNGRPVQSDSTFYNVLSDHNAAPAIGSDGWEVEQSNRAAAIQQMRPSSAMFGAYSRALDTIPFDGEPQPPPPTWNGPGNGADGAGNTVSANTVTEDVVAEKKQEAVRVWPSRLLQGKLTYARVAQLQQVTTDDTEGNDNEGGDPFPPSVPEPMMQSVSLQGASLQGAGLQTDDRNPYNVRI